MWWYNTRNECGRVAKVNTNNNIPEKSPASNVHSFDGSSRRPALTVYHRCGWLIAMRMNLSPPPRKDLLIIESRLCLRQLLGFAIYRSRSRKQSVERVLLICLQNSWRSWLGCSILGKGWPGLVTHVSNGLIVRVGLGRLGLSTPLAVYVFHATDSLYRVDLYQQGCGVILTETHKSK